MGKVGSLQRKTALTAEEGAAERRPRLESERDAGSFASPQVLLPDVVDALGAASCDPVLLVRLGMAQKSLHQQIFAETFSIHRSSELKNRGVEWADQCRTLEQLAIGFEVEKLCGSETRNHLYFPYGGGLEVRAITRPLLRGAARVAQRHPTLKLHIDAHTGNGAPSGIATATARRRAEQVIQDLEEIGVEEERCSMTPWGKRVSSLWSEPEDDTAARAELFFRIDSKEFPKRADYYQLVPQEKQPAPDQQIESSDDEELQALRQQLLRQRMLAMMRVIRLNGEAGEATFVPATASSSEESSDSESNRPGEDVERAMQDDPLGHGTLL
eukprot:CAMPEP_0197627116 /NCGR_PEP_ID=MMETSP1338-20131121/5812_1 /TAXON_ID=43686 ORGANISM="Pelagodinium beii, Strain RCC1491" /NCGR_SAMPLE_ID=MMETSP1338 /ASSEMBLY_ACC=CAM_ASM_000754 /LENGTH=327 /DNA_ID=CAMNT_0043197741 /DNA_START=48 /DNA_END=1032 /DNA_ORIENTATION=+